VPAAVAAPALAGSGVVTAPLRSVDAPVPAEPGGDAGSDAVTTRPVVVAANASADPLALPPASVGAIAAAASADAARSGAPAATIPLARDAAGGFAVQLGAFANYINAQNFLAHVQGQLVAAQVEPRVREMNGLYRVYVGPYANRDDARRVAERITTAFGVATAIAPH
jgi:rare lipoprotein A